MNDFFKIWFDGFEHALDRISDEERAHVLCECGKSCSESGTKDWYLSVYNQSSSIGDFFTRLGKENEFVKTETVEKNREYDLIYPKCLCDLYTCGYVTTGRLCECSRQSLIYNLKAILNEQPFTVTLLSTVLRGDSECRLRVKLCEEQ